METLVLNLCSIWLWITRRRRTSQYSQVADALHSAHAYLLTDYSTRASTVDRGSLLPEQHEALTILERHSDIVLRTSHRFDTLRDCRTLISEQFTETPKAA